jgi:hypothetical protein
MRRSLAIAVAIVVTSSLLSACGTSEYCQSVQAQRTDLDGFAIDRTNKGFAADAKTMHALAKVAPDSLRADYAKIADATDELLATYRTQGVTIEATQKDPRILSSAQRAAITKANSRWNDVVIAHRTAIATNVKQECDITLK